MATFYVTLKRTFLGFTLRSRLTGDVPLGLRPLPLLTGMIGTTVPPGAGTGAIAPAVSSRSKSTASDPVLRRFKKWYNTSG